MAISIGTYKAQRWRDCAEGSDRRGGATLVDLRTAQQNKLLWAIYDEIIAKCPELQGFRNSEVHEFMLIEHFGGERRTMFGRPCVRPLRRSSRLEKAEFAEFVEFILAFMAQQG